MIHNHAALAVALAAGIFLLLVSHRGRQPGLSTSAAGRL